MALSRVKIEKGKIRRLFPKVRSGEHKYMKKCINRLVRRFSKKISLSCDENLLPKKPYRGWEH